jgi:hypothetical protein
MKQGNKQDRSKASSAREVVRPYIETKLTFTGTAFDSRHARKNKK